MKFNQSQNKAEHINLVYIGGGSRGWAWQFMADLANEKDMSGTIKLYDIDVAAAEMNAVIGNKYSQHPDALGKWDYIVVESLDEALENADFIVISIMPGTFEEMYSDVHEPEKYGIYQSVGDTVGPGGFIRAMRTIPLYVDFANKIKEICPNAWVINYTNPMSVCVRTLYEVFPKIKAFGCCHEVFSTQKLLAYMLKDMYGIEDIKREDILVNVLGINHFTWFDRATYKGMDLFPVYKKFIDKYYETGVNIHTEASWVSNVFKSQERVKFDLFRRYGLIAAAGDRHLAEFLPPWYLKNPETVQSWKFRLTTIEDRLKQFDERLQKRERLLSGKLAVSLESSGEEGVQLMRALLGLREIISNVNVPNYGQIPNLPLGAIVETNAVFRKDCIKPLMAGTLPNDIAALVARHCYQQESTVQCGISKDKTMALRTFMNDPLVGISLEDGEKLFNAMLKNTKEYLNGWDI